MRIVCRLCARPPSLTDCARWPLSPGVVMGPGPGDRKACVERTLAHEAPGPPESDGPYRRLARAIRAYDVFPPQLLTGIVPRAPLQPGDTFASCFHALPGFDLFFAGRVVHSFDECVEGLRHAGFSFQTVRGHPMIGEESFCVEKDTATGAVRVRIESWSRPATWLTRLGRPFVRWLQTRAVNAAMAHLNRMPSAVEYGGISVSL